MEECSGVFVLSVNSSPKPRTPPDRQLAALATKQYGLATGAQLRALGIAPSDVAYRVRTGRLHRVHRGVYAVGHECLSVKGRSLAAVLAVGPGAALSHRAAGAQWGFLDWDGDEIEVTVAQRRQGRPGLRLHVVRALAPHDVTVRATIPVTTPARTLLDLADVLGDRPLRRALHEAEVQRRVSHPQLIAQLARANGRRGAARLAALVADGPTPTRSELEDRLLELLARHGLPRPQTNVRLHGPPRPQPNARPAGLTTTIEVDFLFPALDLVIETDGERYHGTRLARAADARRQAELEAAGYRVLRLTWADVAQDEERTVARLRSVLPQQRAARPGVAGIPPAG